MNHPESGGLRLNIYVGNHQHIDKGVQEYLTILRGVGTRHGSVVEESNGLDPEAVNVVIDEFTNASENAKISCFKRKYAEACCIFILTEFLEGRYLVRSFNNFGGVVEAALLSLMNVWFRSRRHDYLGARMREWSLSLAYLPVVFAFVSTVVASYIVLRMIDVERAGRYRKRVRGYLNRLAYFHKRYLGLESHIRYADGVVTSHECIEPGLIAAGWLEPRDTRYMGVLYPELDEAAILDKLSAERSICIEITGSVTPYRQRYIDRINRMIAAGGSPDGLGWARTRAFDAPSAGDDEPPAACSLHPPQTKNWRYSSPMRLFRALQVDGTVPIVTHFFGQNPMEDICFESQDAGTLNQIVRICADRELRAETFKPRMATYNDTARERNDFLMEGIEHAVAHHGGHMRRADC